MPFESDPIFEKINELVSRDDGYMGLIWFDELQPAEQALLAIWELENEVYNGGFLQYFMNGSGNRVPQLCEILRTIGAGNVVSIVEQAIALAGAGVPWDDEVKRFSVLESIAEENKDKLADLDREFYDHQDELNLLLFRYLSKHRDQLEAPDEFWAEDLKP